MSNSWDCLDGELEHWDSIKDEYYWSGILVGNGASRAVWDGYSYSSLYKKAKSEEIEHPLSQADRAIFKSMKTKDFEHVLATLWTAQVVCSVLERHKTASKVHERYESIQTALIEAVHAVHVPWSELSNENVLEKIEAALQHHESIYSTNYDLLLYWVIMTEDPTIKDYFWSNKFTYSDIADTRLPLEPRGYFDITNTELSPNSKRILYLHGGLHLVHLPSGETRKLIANRSNLLTQFGKSLEHGETPLFVTEGTPEDKLASINRSNYLSFAYNEFANQEGDLVVFGHSLGPSDQHLITAMNQKQWEKRNIAISLRQDTPERIRARKANLQEQLPNANLMFFNAETHPLGKPDLKIS